MIGSYIVHSQVLRDQFDCYVIPIRMTMKVGDLGRLSLSKITGSLSIYFKLIGHLLTRRVDAVYLSVAISGFALIRDYITSLLCRLFGVPRIYHMHMKGVRKASEESRFYSILYRSLFRGAHIIHLSQSLLHDLDFLVPSENMHVVENGIPDFGGAAPADAKSDTDVPTLLFLSNLMMEKGPMDLLAASTELLDSGVDHRTVFVGAPNEVEVVTAIEAAAVKYPGRLILAGPQYGSQKDRMLSTADVFVFPTYYRYECQPLSVIEAMSYSLPVVTTREGGLPDMICNGVDGVLVPQRSHAALVEALRSLIAEGVLRRNLGRAARHTYLSKYTVPAFEARFAQAIWTIVSANAKSVLPRLEKQSALPPRND